MNYKQIAFKKPFGNVLLMSVMAVLAAFMTSCGNGTSSAPQHVKIIPQNAAIVVAFDVKQMVGKSVSFEDLFSQKSLEAMGSDEKEAKEGADNAKKFMNSGVDYLNIGYLFAEATNADDNLIAEDNYALAIPLDDAGKFEKFLKGEKEEVKEEGKIKYVSSKKESVFIAWKDKNAVIFNVKKGSKVDFKKRAINLLELKDEQTLLATNKSFAKALGNKADIQIWIDSEKFAKMNGEEAEIEGISLKDNFAAVAIKFEKGEVLVNTDGETSPAVGKIYERIFKNGGIDNKLAKNIPVKKPNLVVSLAVNLKGVKEFLNDKGLLAFANTMLVNDGTSVDEIINIFSGDFLIVAESIDAKNQKSITSVGLNDEKAFEKMLVKVGKDQIKKTDGVYLLEDAPFKSLKDARLVIKDGVVYIASNNYVKDIKAGVSELDGDIIKPSKDNFLTVYANEGFIKDYKGEEQIKSIASVFESINMISGDLKSKNITASAVVKMKEKNKNSLLVIVDAVKNVPKSPKKPKRDAPIEDDAPEAIDETKQQPAKQQ